MGLATVLPARAGTLYVAPGGSGAGTSAAPFGSLTEALAVAGAGDEVVLRPGTYAEGVRTVRGGTSARRLVIRAEQQGTALLTIGTGTVVRVSHPFITIRGLVIDGQYGPYDAVIVDSAAEALHLVETEVRRSTGDCVDMRAPASVLVEDVLIHRCLNAAGGRTDAHGLVAGAVRDLTIRDTRIHTFSGDAVQLDPGRLAPGWDRVTIERCQFWLEPLAGPENGFAAGTVPGENAIDTKTLRTAARATLVVRDTEAWGFREGLLGNMAAFNIKEHVDVTFDAVTVSRSEIAFRLRGPGVNGGAWVRVQNAVVFDVGTGVRYEDDIERVEIWNSTFGSGIGQAFRAVRARAAGLDVQNVLFMGPRSSELAGSSNMPASDSFFLDAGRRDYRLAADSKAVDAGVMLAAVASDRLGHARPSGGRWDVGAYEVAARGR
jgi:hypothetical protein